MELTWRIVIGAAGGFLLGNALWDMLKINNPLLSVMVGAVLVVLAVKP